MSFAEQQMIKDESITKKSHSKHKPSLLKTYSWHHWLHEKKKKKKTLQ